MQNVSLENVKAHFLGQIRKYFQISSAAIFTQYAKCLTFIILLANSADDMLIFLFTFPRKRD